MTLFQVPHVMALSRGRKSCGEGLRKTMTSEQDFFSTRESRGQTTLIVCGSVQSAYSTDEGFRPYSDS